MGIVRNALSFALGAAAGMYAAQNYDVPNVQALVTSTFSTAQHVEEEYRKPPGGPGGSARPPDRSRDM